MKLLISAVVLLLTLFNSAASGKRGKVPGVVVDHLPASAKTFIGSPSLVILPNGDYVASHDYFGPATTEHSWALTAIFKSGNKGKSWEKIAEINGQFWSNLFFHKEALYLMGCWKHHGNLIIRRSVDGGKSWSEPADSISGLLREGEYHTAPVPMVVYNGRLCRAIENAKSNTTAWGKRYSAMVISAPLEADLLKASSWLATNFLPYDSTYLKGKFGGWLEGNAVVTRDGKLVDFLRVDTKEPGRDLAAIVNISEDVKSASFDPTGGFIDFAGGARKFSIRYDEKTNRYWAITNQLTPEHASLVASKVRNRMVLQSSSDLRNWTVHKVLLQHPDIIKHGFQYVDWQFDGKDILFLCRTAYDDEFGGAENFHNANYLTFHRIRNFRRLASKSRS